jgi:hypothetical protein
VLGPKKLGGFGNVAEQASEEAAATGRPISEIELEVCDLLMNHLRKLIWLLIKLFRPNKGEVITLPGLPLMFDYEFSSFSHQEVSA